MRHLSPAKRSCLFARNFSPTTSYFLLPQKYTPTDTTTKMSNRQQARDMQVEFQARFQAKQARREATKAAKQDPVLKKQIQDLLKKGETQKAYQKAKMLLSKQALAQQMDQMADMAELSAAQIQANNAMNRMTHMMASSSKVMNVAQKNTNPEKVCIPSLP